MHLLQRPRRGYATRSRNAQHQRNLKNQVSKPQTKQNNGNKENNAQGHEEDGEDNLQEDGQEARHDGLQEEVNLLMLLEGHEQPSRSYQEQQPRKHPTT